MCQIRLGQQVQVGIRGTWAVAAHIQTCGYMLGESSVLEDEEVDREG
jgi:hypothetical protein